MEISQISPNEHTLHGVVGYFNYEFCAEFYHAGPRVLAACGAPLAQVIHYQQDLPERVSRLVSDAQCTKMSLWPFSNRKLYGLACPFRGRIFGS